MSDVSYCLNCSKLICIHVQAHAMPVHLGNGAGQALEVNIPFLLHFY